MLDSISRAVSQNPLTGTTLATIGGIWAAFKLYALFDFIHLQFLRKSSLGRYKGNANDKSSVSWALITGASDGIGRGFAEELCHRGFNVVLHGRNKKKLHGVRDDLLKQWPDREIKVFVFDATGTISELEERAQRLKDLNLRVLINNVAGGQRPFLRPLTENDAARVQMFIDVDVRFLTQITRILLPQLIQQAPALILNIGSLASGFPCPYGTLVSGGKAYNKAWSRCLNVEMKAEGHDVEVIHVLVGGVATPKEDRTASLTMPNSRGMAKSSLDKVGCGKDVVVGFWAHALQVLPIAVLPSWVCEKLLLIIAKSERAKEQRKYKSQ